jgi:HAMP domain-containing protein
MGLRLKFNLILCLVTVIGLVIAGYFGDQLLKKNAREQVLETAKIMMESAIAVRNYTVSEIRPLLAVQQRRQFISQTVPAYAASKFVAQLQESHPDYLYKEAALNPTNPANRAAAWEEDIINYFRAHRDQTTFIGERDTPAGRALFFSRPIEIKKQSCLACHDRAADAPATLIETYGSANGFGWKLNEVIGAQVVSVPMALPLKHASLAFQTFMASLVGVFVLIVVLLNILLHFFVIKPVRIMSAKAEEVSMGALDVEELVVKGNDEISSLAHSFNRMQRSLGSAVKMLDETMD